MKRFYFLTTISLLLFSPPAGAAPPAYLEGDLSVGYSYRQDNFSVKTKDINALESNIDFDGVLIHQIMTRTSLVSGNFYFRGFADAGWVYGGAASREEFAGSIDIFKGDADIDGCNVFDISGGVGYLYQCLDQGYKFAPLFGYSWSRQDYETTNLKILLDFIHELPVGLCITGFRESYHLDWQGPWIGLDILYDYYACWKLHGSAEYHWAMYHGKFKTTNVTFNNIVFDQLKRKESGCGHGLVFNLGASFDVCGRWTLVLMGNYQFFELWNGCGKDEDHDLVEIKSLDWSCWHITVGVACGF